MEINARNDAGSLVTLLSDQYNQLITLAQGGRLQKAAEEGRLFSACNSTKVATTAGVTTAWTGLCISNLTGSGKNAIVHEFGWGLMIAADVAGNIGLMTASIAAPAAGVTVHNCLDGTGASTAVYADDGATLVTPLQIRTYGEYGTLATTGISDNGPHIVDLKGSIILPPGRTLATFTTLATTACFQFHFVWEEVTA